MKTDRLQLIFAHIDEPVPAEFLDYAKPQAKFSGELTHRQIQKWKSRRVAYFLLYKIFEKNSLDKNFLNHIQKTESGRPYISHSEIDFNISHSGEWVAILFSQSKNKKMVGIDIEHPLKIRPYEKLLAYYADQTEIEEIQQTHYLPELKKLSDRFYLSWCLREAVLKSQGVGIIKLAEVQHRLSEQLITTTYCPQGKLFFTHQLPFYLAYFVEQAQSVLSSPDIYEWKNGELQTVTHLQPIIYQVN